MADESISIEITDKVSPAISTKLLKIAENAKSAHTAVERLKQQLAAINTEGLTRLQNASNGVTAAITKNQIASEKLATAQARTATAAAQAAAAQTRSATAQTQGAAAAQRLAAAQSRTAAASSQAEAAASRAAVAALRLEQAQNKVAVSSQRSASGLLSFARSAAALVGVGLSANAILSSADAYTTLQNKLQNVADSQRQVNDLTNEMFAIANRTRTPVQETAQAFTRFDLALKGLGKSQEESLKLTETVNKALVISGATTNEQASALLQLSQAFNKGKLDGDEFRSVMELMPTAADAIAKQLKVTRGELLKLSPQGKITAQVMVDAFSEAAAAIDAKFGKTIPTLSQSMTVLKNSAVQSFGEINKQLGITSGLSRVILFLAENMKALALAVTVAGVALLTYFGPALYAALATATRGMVAFSLALAANPIGLLVVGITAAVTALNLFGDQVSITSDKSVTLKDGFGAAFSFIEDAASAAARVVASVWNDAIDWINSKTGGLGEKFRDVGQFIINVVKSNINFIVGLFVGGFDAIKAIWENLPQVMRFVFASIVNFGASAVEVLVNSWQIGLRKIADLGSSIAPEMAARLNSALDSATLKLPRLEIGNDAKNAAGEVGDAFSKAFEKDYAGNAAKAFMDRAREIATKRKAAEGAGSQLRGATSVPGASGSDANGALAKAAEKRSTALSKVNAELDNELDRLFLLKPAREAQAKFDAIEEKLIGKKIVLTNQESEALRNKIAAVQAAVQIQQEFDRIYEEAIAPQRNYNASLTAADKLFKLGAISQEQYSREVIKAAEAYKQASDPMSQLNKDMDQQFKLLQLLPKQREVEQQIMQVSNELLQKGVILTKAETEALRDKLKALQELNAVSQQEAALMDASVGKRQQFIDQLQAIKNLRANETSGFGAGDQAGATNDLMQGMGIDTSNFKTSLEEQLSMYSLHVDQLKMLNEQKLISDQEYAAASMQIELQRQNLYLNSASSFFGNLTALQKSGNKKLAAVGKAAAIAQALISTYQSATSAYAAMAAIPYVGPALGAAAAAAAIVAGLANVQQIRATNAGFRQGGFTGSGGVNDIAGVVHGQEFVMNAQATNRVGVSDLQALQTGAATVQRNDQQAGSANVGNQQQPNPAPIVNVPFSAVVVQSKEAALAGLRSNEGRAFILETIEQNGSTVAKIVGVK